MCFFALVCFCLFICLLFAVHDVQLQFKLETKILSIYFNDKPYQKNCWRELELVFIARSKSSMHLHSD